MNEVLTLSLQLSSHYNFAYVHRVIHCIHCECARVRDSRSRQIVGFDGTIAFGVPKFEPRRGPATLGTHCRRQHELCLVHPGA